MGTYYGCEFIHYSKLSRIQRMQARLRFNPTYRRDGWENIEMWGFAVKKDGNLSKCPYMEAIGKAK
jgi:hypothetical protein